MYDIREVHRLDPTGHAVVYMANDTEVHLIHLGRSSPEVGERVVVENLYPHNAGFTGCTAWHVATEDEIIADYSSRH